MTRNRLMWLAVCIALVSALSLGAQAVTAPSPSSEPTPMPNNRQQTLISEQLAGHVHLLNGSEVVFGANEATNYFGVTRLENGSILVGFYDERRSGCRQYSAPCHVTGFQIISPEGKLEYEWSFEIETRKASELHDVEPLPDGGFVAVDMDNERVIIIEGGEITWQWNATERYNPPEVPPPNNWMHINDVDRIGDGRFLVSIRNAHQLVILERGEGVVEVINADPNSDDGHLRGDTSVFRAAHNPQWIGNDTVLIADSGNDRIIEMQRADNGTWVQTWELGAAGGVAFDWPRDADRLPNGHTLITDTRNDRVVEIDENGTVVWSHDTHRWPYEADRLPWGEPVGVESASAPTVLSGGPGHVPVVSLALAGVQTIVALPRWFNEFSLVASFVGAVSVIFAGVLGWSD